MKKVIKSVIALAMAAVMVMALAACSGSAKDKMKGDWIYEKIAGETVADYAKKLGVTNLLSHLYGHSQMTRL